MESSKIMMLSLINVSLSHFLLLPRVSFEQTLNDNKMIIFELDSRLYFALFILDYVVK